MSLCPDSATDSYCCLGGDSNCNCSNGTGVISFRGKPKLGATIGHTRESPTQTAAPAQGTGSGNSPGLAAATTTNSVDARNGGSSSNDNTGVKVGLGVGIPLAIIALVGFALLFLRLRKQDQRMHVLQEQLEARSSAPASAAGFVREWSEHDQGHYQPKAYAYSKNEADSVQVGELGVEDRVELGGYTASEKA